MLSELKTELREILKAIQQRGTFGRNLAISSAGTSSAYLLGFLLSPVLARIYQPEAYGLYALFNAFVANLSIIATMDYINAFVLPRTTREFIPLTQLSLLLVVVVAVLSMFSIIFFEAEILNFFNAQDLTGLIYFVPIIVLFTGINRGLDLWNIREKEFKQGAKAKVVAIVGAKVLTIVYGLFSKGNPFGFIIGELLAKPITSFSLFSKSVKRDLPKVWEFSFPRMLKAAKEYRNYPLYNLPAATLITLSMQLPVYLLSLFFTAATVGHYSLAISLINAPTQLIGIAFAQVYFQKAAEIYLTDPNHLVIITRKLFKRLIYLATVPFGIIAVFGDQIFTIVFGMNWALAGEFASYLSIMAYMSFISASIGSLYRVIRQEKLQFYIVLSGAVFLVLGLFVSLSFQSANFLVLIYSIASALLQFTLIAVVLFKIKLKPIGLLFESIIIFTIGILALYALRYFWPLIS